MTCRCGYAMCYLCRKDLRQESYAHCKLFYKINPLLKTINQ
jgi:hypothetical protein